jgi:ribose/xylose/arabinose/galactoside ABC-type transport system permease subunit
MAYDGLSERTQRIDGWAETGGEEPPDDKRDRLGVHGIWEALLLVVVVVTAIAVYQLNADVLSGAGLQSFLLLATSLGLMAAAAAWSLRSAVPNLAVGPVAAASAMFFGGQAAGGLGFGLGVTLAAAAILGVVLTLVVVGFHVPPWAASLGVGLVLGGWVVSRGAIELPDEVSYHPRDHALYWFLGFAALSLVGGLFSLAGPVRRGLGSFRATGDPAERPGFGPGLAALTALVGSSVLAACGGVLAVLTVRTVTDPGFAWTGIALAAALIGGVSAYGRRGGVAGTLLGVLLLALGLRLAGEEHWKISNLEYAGVALLVGLLVTRLVESAGRPRPSGGPSDEAEEPREKWSGGSAVDSGLALPERPPEAGPAGSGPGGSGPTGFGPAGSGPAGFGPAGSGPSGLGPAGSGPAGPVIELTRPGAEAASGTPPSARRPGAPLPGSGGPGRLPQRGGIGDRAARLQHGLAGMDPLTRTRSWDSEPPAGSDGGPVTPSPY